MVQRISSVIFSYLAIVAKDKMQFLQKQDDGSNLHQLAIDAGDRANLEFIPRIVRHSAVILVPPTQVEYSS